MKLPPQKRRYLIKTLLIMKFIAIFLFAAGLQVSATGYSQTITLAQNNVSLKKVFREIEKQSGYQFFYKDRLIRQTGTVSINVRNATVESVLNACFKNQPLSYTLIDKIVVVKAKKHIELINPLAVLAAPVSIISGTVKDDKGNPLAGVSVVVKGSTKGTSTVMDGSFSIDTNEGDVLEFTMVGYEKKNVTVSSKKSITVVMSVVASLGDEVVVVGYGTQKKVSLTSAVNTVKGEDLQRRPVSNVEQALQGQVPGLT
ncbi:MAG TPA: carboxypeptidase-like regulatory domain-containing protein, partial [Hanamia sp.]|nr:carboxypeptidase-like regulatory domain-containing protein [Hanamia sp.]